MYTTNRSCLDVNRQCVEDEVCNKQLSLYLKVCLVNKKCNMEGCQAAIRFFYQNMPFEVAQMMIFCDCIEHDESCHRAKELLHGKPCAVTAVPPPSCLNVIHMCEENELCRWAEEVFCPVKYFWIMIWSNHFYIYSLCLIYNKIIFCTVSAIFDIFTDVCITCGNSRSNSTSKLKWLIFRKVWNLMWAFLTPVSWDLTPFLLDKLCYCIFSLPLSSDNTCLSAPLPSSNLPKLCSRPDKVCLVEVITFRGQSLTHCTNSHATNLACSKNFHLTLFISRILAKSFQKAGLKHAQITKLRKDNALSKFRFILIKHATGLPIFVAQLNRHLLWMVSWPTLVFSVVTLWIGSEFYLKAVLKLTFSQQTRRPGDEFGFMQIIQIDVSENGQRTGLQMYVHTCIGM